MFEAIFTFIFLILSSHWIVLGTFVIYYLDMCDKEKAEETEPSSAWSPEDDVVLEWAGCAEGISEDQ